MPMQEFFFPQGFFFFKFHTENYAIIQINHFLQLSDTIIYSQTHSDEDKSLKHPWQFKYNLLFTLLL